MSAGKLSHVQKFRSVLDKTRDWNIGERYTSDQAGNWSKKSTNDGKYKL